MLLINVLEAIHRGVHLPPTMLPILCVRSVCATTDVTGDDWNITSDAFQYAEPYQFVINRLPGKEDDMKSLKYFTAARLI